MGIYVWGTGCGASELMDRGLEPARVAAFIDSFPGCAEFLGRPVLLPEQLDVADCELLIVTTRQAEAVEDRCRELGIPAEKCLFLKNYACLQDRNAGCIAAPVLLGEGLLRRLLPEQQVVTAPAQLADRVLPREELTNDYVRLATLELLCRRLGDVPGAAAELGVYRGFFARSINRLLPERKLYLFNSFEGFAESAGASEAFQAAHTNTSLDRVLAIMPHREKIVVKPGFFPASLEGLEETFCLVSLDVDFRESTLEGLRYFWPRLSPGGYLLLHDWGSPRLPGVAVALEEFERELGRKIPAVPLCDVGGSLVLCKCFE